MGTKITVIIVTLNREKKFKFINFDWALIMIISVLSAFNFGSVIYVLISFINMLLMKICSMFRFNGDTSNVIRINFHLVVISIHYLEIEMLIHGYCLIMTRDSTLYTQGNLFEILLNPAEIRLHLHFSIDLAQLTDVCLLPNQSENGKYNFYVSMTATHTAIRSYK